MEMSHVESAANPNFGALFKELLSDGEADHRRDAEFHSATLSLALDEHKIRRESLENLVADKESGKVSSSSSPRLLASQSETQHSGRKPLLPKMGIPERTIPNPSDDGLKSLIGTMDSAISKGKRTLRQRLEEAMSQSARRQRNNKSRSSSFTSAQRLVDVDEPKRVTASDRKDRETTDEESWRATKRFDDSSPKVSREKSGDVVRAAGGDTRRRAMGVVTAEESDYVGAANRVLREAQLARLVLDDKFVAFEQKSNRERRLELIEGAGDNAVSSLLSRAMDRGDENEEARENLSPSAKNDAAGSRPKLERQESTPATGKRQETRSSHRGPPQRQRRPDQPPRKSETNSEKSKSELDRKLAWNYSATKYPKLNPNNSEPEGKRKRTPLGIEGKNELSTIVRKRQREVGGAKRVPRGRVPVAAAPVDSGASVSGAPFAFPLGGNDHDELVRALTYRSLLGDGNPKKDLAEEANVASSAEKTATPTTSAVDPTRANNAESPRRREFPVAVPLSLRPRVENRAAAVAFPLTKAPRVVPRMRFDDVSFAETYAVRPPTEREPRREERPNVERDERLSSDILDPAGVGEAKERAEEERRRERPEEAKEERLREEEWESGPDSDPGADRGGGESDGEDDLSTEIELGLKEDAFSFPGYRYEPKRKPSKLQKNVADENMAVDDAADAAADALRTVQKYDEARRAAIHRMVEEELRAVVLAFIHDHGEKTGEEANKERVDQVAPPPPPASPTPQTRLRLDVDVLNDDAEGNYLKVTRDDVERITEEALREKVRSFFGIDDLRVWTRPATSTAVESEEEEEKEKKRDDGKEEKADASSGEMFIGGETAPPPPTSPPPPPSLFPSHSVTTPLQTPISTPQPSLRVTAAVQTSFAGREKEEEATLIETPPPSNAGEEYEEDSFQEVSDIVEESVNVSLAVDEVVVETPPRVATPSASPNDTISSLATPPFVPRMQSQSVLPLTRFPDMTVPTPPLSGEDDLVSQISDLAKEVAHISVQVSLARESLFKERIPTASPTMADTVCVDSSSSSSTTEATSSQKTEPPTDSSSSQFVTDTAPDTVSAGEIVSASLGGVDYAALLPLPRLSVPSAVFDSGSNPRGFHPRFPFDLSGQRLIADPQLETIASDSIDDLDEEKEAGEFQGYGVVDSERTSRGGGNIDEGEGGGRGGDEGGRREAEGDARTADKRVDATDDSLESGPLDDSSDEEEREEARPLSEGESSLPDAGLVDGRSDAVEMRRSVEGAVCAPDAVGGADSPVSRNSSPRHFTMRGEVRDLRPQSVDADVPTTPEAAGADQISPVSLARGSSKIISVPRTIYVQPSLESQDESVNLMDDNVRDISLSSPIGHSTMAPRRSLSRDTSFEEERRLLGEVSRGEEEGRLSREISFDEKRLSGEPGFEARRLSRDPSFEEKRVSRETSVEQSSTSDDFFLLNAAKSATIAFDSPTRVHVNIPSMVAEEDEAKDYGGGTSSRCDDDDDDDAIDDGLSEIEWS